MGLNAVVYRLPLDAPLRLDDVKEELAEVNRAGLKMVLQLPTALGHEQQIRLGFREYWHRLEQYVAAVVPALKDEPGLVAWQTDDFLEKAVRYDDREFVEFLEQRYASLDNLNRVWGSHFRGWDDITRQTALSADDEQPWGVGVASVDVADWQVFLLREIMARWAALVRRWDEIHPLMTGRVSLYRTLASVPYAYDVVMPAIRPDVLEDDPLTGNVHAVDMARRGGRFEVVPSLYVPLPPSSLFHEGALRRWVLEAAAHGARGFAVEDWYRIATYKPAGADAPVPLDEAHLAQRMEIIRRTVGDLTRESNFGVNPSPSYAFLWMPYAGGLEVLGVPVYGYIEAWSPVEPGRLFFTFRRGCAWGIPDFLTGDDICVTDLEKYGAIFAPHALSVPEPAQNALEDWALKGGVLVADVGLGMGETGDWRNLPSPVAAVMGFSQLYLGNVLVANWQVTRRHELLPDWVPGARAVGSVDLKQPQTAPATERRPQAIKGWVAYLRPGATVTAVALADTRPSPGEKEPLMAGVFAHSYGSGGGIFASFRLWDRWAAADPVFAAFHGSLCARRSQYVLNGGFWPRDFAIVPEVDGVSVVSHGGGLVELTALGVDDALFSGAYCLASASSRLSDGRRTGDVCLLIEAPPMSLLRLRRQGVSVRPYEGTCLSRLELYGPGAAQIMIYGDSPIFDRTSRGLTVRRVTPVTTRVIVKDADYPVKPGSKHRVTVTSRRGESRSFEIVADEQGRMDFDVTAQMTTVLVEPVDAHTATESQ
jgi:hypothetical protein